MPRITDFVKRQVIALSQQGVSQRHIAEQFRATLFNELLLVIAKRTMMIADQVPAVREQHQPVKIVELFASLSEILLQVPDTNSGEYQWSLVFRMIPSEIDCILLDFGLDPVHESQC